MNPKKLAKPEVVLELLAEGGSLTLMVADVIEWEDSSRPSGKFGTIQRYPDLIEEKIWMSEKVFWVVRDERTLLALFDKEDLPAIDFYAKTEFREDFYVALKEFMDPYEWWLLSPGKIHADWEEEIEWELDEHFPGWGVDPDQYAKDWYSCHAWHKRLVHPDTSPSPSYGKAMDQALLFAADSFRNKTRKGTDIPYLTHLLAVTALVGEFGGNEDQLIAALLHDSLEDLEWVTIDYLKEHFGAEVTKIVMALSDATEHPKPEWRTRKTRYLERLAEEGPQVKLVSAADKLHNIQCLIRDLRTHGDEVWKRFNAGREDQVWYYQAALEALGRGWKDPLLDELREAVGRLETLSRGPMNDYPDTTRIYDSEDAKRFVSSWTGLDISLVEEVLNAKFHYLELAGIALSDEDDDLRRERAIYRHLLPETPGFIDERERAYLALVTKLDEDTLLRVEQGEMAYKDSLGLIEWEDDQERDSSLGAPELTEAKAPDQPGDQGVIPAGNKPKTGSQTQCPPGKPSTKLDQVESPDWTPERRKARDAEFLRILNSMGPSAEETDTELPKRDGETNNGG